MYVLRFRNCEIALHMHILARNFAAFALSVLNAMADQRLTAELCTAIASAMNDGDRGARSRWVSMRQMLIDANLARYSNLHPSMLICHNGNRGGHGLNAFNSHLLGWKVGKVGADLQELLHACCIELSANADFCLGFGPPDLRHSGIVAPSCQQ